MSDIGLAAAISSAQSQSQVANAIGVKVLKLANQQQQNIATLVDDALAQAEQTCSSCSESGSIDIRA